MVIKLFSGNYARDLFFKRSTNNGASFGSTINLSNDDNNSVEPDIAVDGDNVYVVWNDETTNGADESQLFFKRSTNNGASFSSVKKLDIQFEELDPRIAASGNNVYIAVTGGVEDGRELFFTKSTDKGSSFSKFISINDNNDDSFLGDIAAKGSNVYIVWSDRSEGGGEHAFFTRSTDNGKSFGSTKDFGPGFNPQLDTISKNIYVVWPNDEGNIAFKASKNDGASFGSTKILNNDGSIGTPQISSSGNAVRIVWAGSAPSDSDIFFRASGNEGDSFGILSNINSLIIS